MSPFSRLCGGLASLGLTFVFQPQRYRVSDQLGLWLLILIGGILIALLISTVIRLIRIYLDNSI